jgi:hypothetical protein
MGGTNNIFFVLFDKFQPNAWTKTMLQKMFMSVEGILDCIARTKVKIFFASYPKGYSSTGCLFFGRPFENSVNQAQKTDPYVSRQAQGQVCPELQRETKERKSDCIGIEKRSFQLSSDGKSFSMYSTIDPRENLGPAKLIGFHQPARDDPCTRRTRCLHSYDLHPR